jgi:hypothetical protein
MGTRTAAPSRMAMVVRCSLADTRSTAGPATLTPLRSFLPARARKQPLRPTLENRISPTSSRILASTAPGRLQQLVRHAQGEGGHQRAPEVADAAEDHDEEGVDDVGLAEVRADVGQLRQGHTGDAGDPEPRAKVRASTRALRTPRALAMARFCATARTCRPRRVCASGPAARQTSSAKTRIARRFQVRASRERPPRNRSARPA